jgi:hypothetical protein
VRLNERPPAALWVESVFLDEDLEQPVVGRLVLAQVVAVRLDLGVLIERREQSFGLLAND